MRYLTNTHIDPYFNMAFDEYCLEKLSIDEPVFYLWQNRPSVIIGANQEVHTEVNLDYLKENDISLVRRVTGGGAVYHDQGNLNFTFLCRRDLFDIERQDQIILNALNHLGIKAEKNGRNDLVVDDRKFSGHAYYKGKKNCFHHGSWRR